jgi:predicted RNase H-like HicB family nuclease
MKTIVQFSISQEDGTYTADGVNVPIVTEGATFEELQENIRDAVALYFEGSDPSSLGFATWLPSASLPSVAQSTSRCDVHHRAETRR